MYVRLAESARRSLSVVIVKQLKGKEVETEGLGIAEEHRKKMGGREEEEEEEMEERI